MEIIVSDKKQVYAVQHEFHEIFPFLRVEFFQSNGGNHLKRVTPDKTFDSYGSKHQADPITITPSMTVGELETKIQNYYGLQTRILRKSGKAWLETSLTDHWSLQEQNEQGKALSV